MNVVVEKIEAGTTNIGDVDALIADGADVTEGAIADAVVAAGATGSLSAKLRRATQGLEDLKTLIVLAAGNNNIGDVDALTADGADVTQGALADAVVAAGATGSISAKLRRATQGLEDLKSLIVLAAGNNNIGDVDALIADGANVAQGAIADAVVAAGATGTVSAKLRRVTQGLEDLKTLIVLAAGNANIGDVDALTADGADVTQGAIADAVVAAGATGTLSAKLRRATQGLEDLKTLIVLAAGNNNIGDVDVLSIAAGDTNIGNVDVVTDPVYTSIAVGELAGAVAATQMPAQACRMVRFKAAYDNAGRVYIGGSGVTVKDGTTDTTTGIELSAGEETGWLPVDNLNRFYRICNNAGDDLTYLAMVS